MFIAVVGVDIISVAYQSLESGSDEVEVLSKLRSSVYGVFPNLVVTILCDENPRVVVSVFALRAPFAVFVSHRSGNRVIQQKRFPYVFVVRTRLVLLFQCSRYTYFNKSGLGYVHVEVHAVVPAVVVGVGLIVLQRGVAVVHTAFLNIAHRCEIACVGTAARYVNVGTESGCAVLEQQFHPVDIGEHLGVELVVEQIKVVVAVGGRHVPAFESLVHHSCVYLSVDEFRCLRASVVAVLNFSVYACRSVAAVLCRYENDAVGTARTVDGSCGSVFQHAEGLYVLRVYVVDVTLKTVDEHERAASSTEGGDTADPELGHVVARITCRLPCEHARYDSRE